MRPAAWVRAWNDFWFGEVHPLRLAGARVLVAASGLYVWAGTLPIVGRYYTDAGEYPIRWARLWGTEWVVRFLMPDALGEPWVVWLLFAAWGAALVGTLVGWRTRLSLLAAAALTTWFLFRNATFLNGGDEVLRYTLTYLALGHLAVPAGATLLSLDRRRAGVRDVVFVPAWTVRLVQVQVCIVYMVSGFWKVVGPPWWDGSALYIAMGNPAFSRFGVPDWAWAQPLFAALTVSIAWWEFLFPLLVAGRRTREPALAFGVALHGGILLLMNIGAFPLVMLACYPTFCGDHRAERARRRLQGTGRGRAAQPVAPSSSA